MPLMVTGGISKLAVANQALEKNSAGFAVSMLGIASALAMQPDLPKQWRQQLTAEIALPVVNWRNQTVASLATMAVVKAQLELLAQGKPTNPDVSPAWALLCERLRTRKRTKRYRAWRAASGSE